jgi:hypothetical protein
VGVSDLIEACSAQHVSIADRVFVVLLLRTVKQSILPGSNQARRRRTVHLLQPRHVLLIDPDSC